MSLENEIKELTGAVQGLVVILTAMNEVVIKGEVDPLLNTVSEGSTVAGESEPEKKVTKKKAKKKAAKKSANTDITYDSVKALAKDKIAAGDLTRAAAKKIIKDHGADKIDDLDEDDETQVQQAADQGQKAKAGTETDAAAFKVFKNRLDKHPEDLIEALPTA